MIFSHPTFEKMIEIDDNFVSVLTVENPRQFASYICELGEQMSGEHGQFNIFQDNECMSISSVVNYLFNPFDSDRSSKDLQNGILRRMRELAVSEDYYLRLNELLTSINAFASDLLGDVPINLEYVEPDPASLVKYLYPHYVSEKGRVSERLLEYMSVYSEFTDTEMFIFVNLRTMMDDEEFNDFCRSVLYNHVRVLLIESHCGKKSPYVRETIIDSDLCEIHYEN